MTPPFLPAVRLCEVFCTDAVRRLLDEHYPGLPHTTDSVEDLCDAYEAAGRVQNALRLSAPGDAVRRPYHGRPYDVIDADRYAAALRDAITDPAVAGLPPVGGVDQYTDSADLPGDPALRRAVAAAVLQLDSRTG